MNESPIVSFQHVSMQFPGVLANHDVSLDIRKGEVFALVGENGAGTSTLMNILYGMNTPTSGKVYVKGREITDFSPSNAIAHGVGMVHQHFMLVPSSLSNLRMNTALRSIQPIKFRTSASACSSALKFSKRCTAAQTF